MHKHPLTARNKLMPQHHCLVTPYSPPSSTSPHGAPHSSDPVSMFACPLGHCRAATTPAFDPLKPHKCTWCSSCRKYIGGKKWLCPCRVPWATCPHHVSVLAPVPMPNRKRRTQSIQGMSEREAANKLARIEPARCSRIILTPALAAKFPHLASSS